MKRLIVARCVQKRGRAVWIVRVPLDLQSPNEPARREFGADEKSATAFARRLMESRSSLAGEFYRLPVPEQAALIAALREVGLDGIRSGVELFKRQAVAAKVSTAEVLNLWMASKENAGLRKEYEGQVRHIAKSLRARLPAVLGDVRAEHLAEWLKGSGWSVASQKWNLNRARSFFEFARARKFIAENPCDAVQKPKAPYRAKPILPVTAWRLILQDCQRHDRGLLWWIVPVLFDGLRNAESRRAKPENFRDGIVDLDEGEQLKLNVRRAVRLSAAARAWLAVAGQRDLSNLRRRRVAMLERTGLAWPKNCHRHSFCSYSLELFGSKETARKANHSEKTLFTNYANKVTKSDAKKFFQLRPIQPQRTHRAQKG